MVIAPKALQSLPSFPTTFVPLYPSLLGGNGEAKEQQFAIPRVDSRVSVKSRLEYR